MFGLYILGALFTMIVVMWINRRGNDAGFNATLLQSPFRAVAPLPAEWPEDLAGFVPRSGILIEGWPPALLLVGHIKGTSVVVAGAARQSLEDYLGFVLPSNWGIAEAQCAELVRIAKPDITRPIGAGACLLLWRRNHYATLLVQLIATARRDVFTVMGANKAAPVATAETPSRADAVAPVAVPPPGVQAPVLERAAPAVQASTAALPSVDAPSPPAVSAQTAPVATPTKPNDVFVDDNMWGWRKEGNMGYATLPPDALQPQMRVIYLEWHEMLWVPAEIGLLENLEEFALDNTQLKELPEEIGMCRKLRSIRILNSQLTKIPNSIFSLPCLETLSFDYNELEVLPEEVGQLLSLRELNVSGNRIREIPASVGNLARLELLSVACTTIKRLPDSLAKLQNLKELVIWNGFPETEKWTKALPNTKISYP